MSKRAAAPSAGERIGRYELLQEIGRGGFGVVYRARQTGLGAEVALKLMLPLQTTQAKSLQLIERFEQEARVIRELEHPCALKVRDFGRTEAGMPYLVTEFVRGTPLSQVIARNGPLEPARVMRIATQILGCLAEAHHRSIIHRDLKPPNIMLRDIYGERDAVKVLDFGIAKVAAARGGVRTQTGQALGTPYYIAPEQCKGERNLDGRVDLYALGLIMAECLCGKRVVNTPDPMTAIYVHTSPLPHRFPPQVTESALFAVIRRATAKDRDERYANALAMREGVDAVTLGTAAVAATTPAKRGDPFIVGTDDAEAAELGDTVPMSDPGGSTRPESIDATSATNGLGSARARWVLYVVWALALLLAAALAVATLT